MGLRLKHVVDFVQQIMLTRTGIFVFLLIEVLNSTGKSAGGH